MEDARDIQGISHYNLFLEKGFSEKEAFNELLNETRDYSRNTVYWEDDIFGGYSKKEPWINFQKQNIHNVEEQMRADESIWKFVQSLIRLRNDNLAFQVGSMSIDRYEDLIILERGYGDGLFVALMNFGDTVALGEVDVNLGEYVEVLKSSEGAVYLKDGKYYIKEDSSVVFGRRG